MSRQIGYREFCQYVVLNDDISELSMDQEYPVTILQSTICHLYDKEWEEVRKYLIKLKEIFNR